MVFNLCHHTWQCWADGRSLFIPPWPLFILAMALIRSAPRFSSTWCVLSFHYHTHFLTQRAPRTRDMRWPLTAARLPAHILSRGFPWPKKLMVPPGWGVSMDTHRDGGINGKEQKKREKEMSHFCPQLWLADPVWGNCNKPTQVNLFIH